MSWLSVLGLPLLVVGVLVLVVAVIALRASCREAEALSILRSRFARGDIDAETFVSARDTLDGDKARPRPRSLLLVGAVLALSGVVVGLASCTAYDGMGGMMGRGMMGMMGPAPTAPPGTSVTMAGARFTPATLSIRVGETVSWFNDDTLGHTVSAADGSWDSGTLAPGGSLVRRFDAPGNFGYICRFHAWMTGSVTVSR